MFRGPQAIIQMHKKSNHVIIFYILWTLLKSWTYRRYQSHLGFPGDSLPNLHCSYVQLLLWALPALSSVLSRCGMQLSWINISWLTQLLEDIPPLHPEKLFFGCILGLFIHHLASISSEIHKHHCGIRLWCFGSWAFLFFHQKFV